jgi:TIR domain-containing protein
MRAFVSHAGRDSAWAGWAAWHLRSDGYPVERDRLHWAAGFRAADVAVASEACFEVERLTTEEWSAVLATRARLVLLRVEDVPVAAVLRSYVFRDLFGLAEADAGQAARPAVAGPRIGLPRRRSTVASARGVYLACRVCCHRRGRHRRRTSCSPAGTPCS